MPSAGGRLRAADWLSLAAAPTFALMASVTALLGDARASAICSQTGMPSLLSGMIPMYLLMAAFHLSPWLRRAASSPR